MSYFHFFPYRAPKNHLFNTEDFKCKYQPNNDGRCVDLNNFEALKWVLAVRLSGLSPLIYLLQPQVVVCNENLNF